MKRLRFVITTTPSTQYPVIEGFVERAEIIKNTLSKLAKNKDESCHFLHS
jgi:hypothetical protein